MSSNTSRIVDEARARWEIMDERAVVNSAQTTFHSAVLVTRVQISIVQIGFG